MRKIAVIAAVALTLSGVPDATAEVRLSDAIRVLGDVTGAAGPIEDALVIAFNLSTSYVIQTFTEKSGRFELPPLPSGVYRIIAVKKGFAPAVATITPARSASRKLALRLDSIVNLTNEQRDAVWQARRSIPSDILRDLNIVDETYALDTVEAADQGRFRGEMVSLTGVADGSTSAAFAQTQLGVRGDLGRGWMVDLSGAVRTIDQGAFALPMADTAVAESAGVSMEIRSGVASAYRIDSTRNTWLLSGVEGEAGLAADLESHNIEWSGKRSRVQLHYLAHENLFNGSDGSELFELAAASRFVNGERAQLGVELRVGQESVAGSPVAIRTADLATRGSVSLLPSLAVQYGLNSRLTEFGNEWAPETGILLRLSPTRSILVRGSYKIDPDDSPLAQVPSLMFLGQQGWRVVPKSEYSIAYTAGASDAARMTAAASVAEIDALLRVVFDASFEEFWDAFYLEPGDTYRNVSLAVRKQLGDSVAVDVNTIAGEAISDLRPEETKQFVSASMQSLYVPTGTAVHVAWRFIEQPAIDRLLELQESERINLRVAQSLGLPLGLRVLIGVDLARALNSPVVADNGDAEGYQRRLVGGLSLAF